MAADSYARFMGRFSEPLAVQFLRAADVQPGQRALDVGCGPGALTAKLVERLGADAVTAIDPSPPFVAAIKERLPGVDAHLGTAEHLPYSDGQFDCALAQLVVHFMADPVVGLREMGRVTRSGGVVAACVWDHAGGQGPLSTFWRAAHDLDVSAPDESSLAGARGGHLTEIMTAAGLREISEDTLAVEVKHPTFEEWWEPFTRGVGPAGAYVLSLSADRRAKLREICRGELGEGPFNVRAEAWAARGLA